MRLRLVHTLSLLMLSFAWLAVLALGGLTAWNLRHGFGEYLAARDVVHLERFAALAEQALVRAGGLQALPQLDLRALMDELSPRPEDGPPPRSIGTAPPGLPPPDLDRPPPPGGPDAFPRRLTVVGLDGQTRVGRPLPAHDGPDVDRPIRLDGQVVAWARLMPATPVPGGGEARFLRDQYAGILGVSLALVGVALVTAAWLARRWARPLVAVQHATQRLARGEFDVRLRPGLDFADRGDEIGDVVRNVNHMAEGLQRLEAARRRWLADISHELRTPLTVLRGDIEALFDGVRPLRHEAIAVLREEVLRLGKLVDDLHLLAMSDLQTLPCHFGEIDAVALLRQAVARFDPRARAAGLQIALDLDGASTLAVRWDAARIEQLLANLLDNSLRYTDAPGRIVITLRRAGDRVAIAVDDSAPGAAPEDLQRLFEPLFRADPARGRGGSGLGLAIADAIAAAHGGHLAASASALGGLRIAIDLPVLAGLPA